MKPSYHSLRSLFEKGISVRDIVEPLASFDKSSPTQDVLEYLSARRFDIVGIRDNGYIIGYAQRNDIKSGMLGDFMLPIPPEITLQDNDSLFVALDHLRREQWAIVKILNHPGGIVTRGDLQKHPVRMWLFGIISILEMQLSQEIFEEFQNESWLDLISKNRHESARKIFSARIDLGIDINILECTQFCDKGQIIRRSANLMQRLGFSSKREVDLLFREIQKLRDSLAHSNRLASESWPGYVRCAEKIGDILERLESGYR